MGVNNLASGGKSSGSLTSASNLLAVEVVVEEFTWRRAREEDPAVAGAGEGAAGEEGTGDT